MNIHNFVKILLVNFYLVKLTLGIEDSTTILVSSYGYFSSQEGPTYENSLEKEWILTTNGAIEMVGHFSFFDVEYDEDCLFDEVIVDVDGVEQGYYCGQTVPEYYWTGTEIRILFLSDHMVSGMGFLFEYNVVFSPTNLDYVFNVKYPITDNYPTYAGESESGVIDDSTRNFGFSLFPFDSAFDGNYSTYSMSQLDDQTAAALVT